jgi:hypothetical protein
MTQVNQSTSDVRWKGLYQIGAIAVLLMILIVPIQLAVFSVAPPPSTAEGWFDLFQVCCPSNCYSSSTACSLFL